LDRDVLPVNPDERRRSWRDPGAARRPPARRLPGGRRRRDDSCDPPVRFGRRADAGTWPPMLRQDFTVDTRGRLVIDVTAPIEAFAASAGTDGLVHVFLPHATAGVALMETGSGSEADLEEVLGRLIPRDDRYAHRHGSTGHGGDHLVPVFVPPSMTLPVEEGRLVLG